ncbi:hypothetical protein HHI36_001814 [Cryptolaemus montrouzieri]|uniref:Uncharacterized protein n=1 Tax=Cryptolaemus montrouzieri TaxID=559131 RepID=A0ABD2P8X2_9CUCU
MRNSICPHIYHNNNNKNPRRPNLPFHQCYFTKSKKLYTDAYRPLVLLNKLWITSEYSVLLILMLKILVASVDAQHDVRAVCVKEHSENFLNKSLVTLMLIAFFSLNNSRFRSLLSWHRYWFFERLLG